MKYTLALGLWIGVISLPAFAETAPAEEAVAAAPAISPADDAISRLKQAQDAKRNGEQSGGLVAETSSLASGSAKNLVYFLAVVFAGLSLFKRFSKGRTGEDIQESIVIHARKQLSSRGALLIVEAEGQRLLLAQNGDDLSFLHALDGTAAALESSWVTGKSARLDAIENTTITRSAIG